MSRTVLAAASLIVALTALGAGCAGPDVGQRWTDSNRKFVASVRAGVDVGQIKHTEESNLVDMDSEWETTVYRPRLLADLRLRSGWEFSGEFNGFFAVEDEEEWKLGGLSFSENDMDLSGYEWRVMAGWGVDVQSFGRVSLLGGLCTRTIKMDREFSDGSSASTDADIAMWEAELRLSLPLRKETVDTPITFEASASYGRLINPEADVDGAGTIEGDFGWIFRTRLGMDVQVTDRLSVYFGGFYEDLKIHGGVDEPYEWADSDTTAGGGEISVRYRF